MTIDAYRDAARSMDERVSDLLAQMTLAEKVAQLGGAWFTRLMIDGAIAPERCQRDLGDGIGHVTRISGESGLPPDQTAALANEIQHFLVEETRLGIPAIVHEEALAGFCARDATQFPQAIGLASTWNPDLVEEIATDIRRHLLAVGARVALSPVLDVARDPRWGRVEETYGEDPYLVSRFGVAYVRGLQGSDLRTGVAATAKHFLGYGMPEGGFNHAPAQVGPRLLRDVVAAPFRAVIAEAHLAGVMNAYNEVDGLPCAGSAQILDDLLRGELGFDGVVVADYWSVSLLMSFHNVAADEAEAARMAVGAGLDVELPALSCYRALVALVTDGHLAEAVVDRSVARVLRQKFALGLFEEPFVDAPAALQAFDTPAGRALARRAAAESVVLLANDGVLPLPSGIGTLAVLGPCAADRRLLLGDYHFPSHTEIITEGQGGLAPTAGGGAGAPFAYVQIVTPLEGITAAADPGTRIVHVAGCDVHDPSVEDIGAAVAAAREADVALVFVGARSGLTRSSDCGELRDSCTLDLPGAQQQLVEAVVGTGTPTVVVLVSGRVHAIPWIAAHAGAVVQAWLPGEEGGSALAEVLFGRVNPAGRLPVTMPRTVGQVPCHYDHHSGAGRSQMYGDYADGPAAPLFPFGHGLSYTRFEYADLTVEPAAPTTVDPLVVTCTVTNTGPVAGDEVVQLYLRDEVASVARPVLQLAGFVRVALDVGASTSVRFDVDPGRLGFHDADLRHVVEPGAATILVGASSADIRLRTTVQIGGERRAVPAAVPPTRVSLA